MAAIQEGRQNIVFFFIELSDKHTYLGFNYILVFQMLIFSYNQYMPNKHDIDCFCLFIIFPFIAFEASIILIP